MSPAAAPSLASASASATATGLPTRTHRTDSSDSSASASSASSSSSSPALSLPTSSSSSSKPFRSRKSVVALRHHKPTADSCPIPMRLRSSALIRSPESPFHQRSLSLNAADQLAKRRSSITGQA